MSEIDTAQLIQRIQNIETQLARLKQPEVLYSVTTQGLILNTYQLLLGLRGLWPMASIDSLGGTLDSSGQEQRTLTKNGNPVYGLLPPILAPYIQLDGTGDWLSRGDEPGLQIRGTETYFPSQASSVGAARGLTLGGWFRPTNGAINQALLVKWGGASLNAYGLFMDGFDAENPFQFHISEGGITSHHAESTRTTTMSTWQFAAGRFNDADTGAELTVWSNDTKTTNSTTYASIFNTPRDFTIGAQHSGATLFTGRMSLCFLCAAALPDSVIEDLYAVSRPLFDV
jgi:hypothetical protein